MVLGRLGATRGLAGDLRFHPYNESSDTLEVGASVFIDERVYKIAFLDTRKVPWFVRLTSATSIDTAKPFVGKEIWVPRSTFPQPTRDEFLYSDLEALKVVTESGDRGVVEGVVVYPASTVLKARLGELILEVPLTEPYFVDVDFERGEVILGDLSDLIPPRPARSGSPLSTSDSGSTELGLGGSERSDG